MHIPFSNFCWKKESPLFQAVFIFFFSCNYLFRLCLQKLDSLRGCWAEVELYLQGVHYEHAPSFMHGGRISDMHLLYFSWRAHVWNAPSIFYMEGTCLKRAFRVKFFFTLKTRSRHAPSRIQKRKKFCNGPIYVERFAKEPIYVETPMNLSVQLWKLKEMLSDFKLNKQVIGAYFIKSLVSLFL